MSEPSTPKKQKVGAVGVTDTVPFVSPGKTEGSQLRDEESERLRRIRILRDQRESDALRRTGFAGVDPLYNPIAFALEPDVEDLRNLDEASVIFVDLDDGPLYDNGQLSSFALNRLREALNERNLDFEEVEPDSMVVEPLGAGAYGTVFPVCIARLNVRQLDDLNLSVEEKTAVSNFPRDSHFRDLPALESLGMLRSSRSCLYVLKITNGSVAHEASLARIAARIGVGPSFTRSFMAAFHNSDKNQAQRSNPSAPQPTQLNEQTQQGTVPRYDCMVHGAILQRRQGLNLRKAFISGALQMTPNWAVQRIALDAVRCLEQMAVNYFFHGDLHVENCTVNVDKNGNYLRGETRAFSIIDMGRSIQADLEAVCAPAELGAMIPWPDRFLRRFVPVPLLDVPTGANIEGVEAKYNKARSELPRMIFWNPRHNFVDSAVLLHRLKQMSRTFRDRPREHLAVITEAVERHMRGWHNVPMTNLLDLEDLDLTLQVISPLNGDVALAWHDTLRKTPKKVRRLLPKDMFVPYAMGLQTLLAMTGVPLATVMLVDIAKYATITEKDVDAVKTESQEDGKDKQSESDRDDDEDDEE
jgi:hypothetical protein